MRAAVRTRYGPPEVVRVIEVDRPTIGPHDLLVRVHVTTVTRTDCGFRAAEPFLVRFFTGLTKPRRTILGGEFAGVVEEVGADVSSFSVGDRVFGFNERFGAHAELMSIAEDGPVATIPERFGFEDVAPSTEASHYAMAIVRRSKLRRGQRALVNGATGGIGSAAVQFLKARGVVVTAVCDTPNIELVEGLGADRVIDRNTTDFTTDRERYDAVLDAVGKSSFFRCRPILEPHGRYLSSDLGPLSMNPFLALATKLWPGRHASMPLPGIRNQRVVLELRSMLEAGTFRPVIDRAYPLQEIAEAYRYVETGTKIGNVLISVTG